MSLETVNLIIAGQAWRGWTGVRVIRSLEALAAQFELSLTDRPPWDRPGTNPRPIRAGDACEVKTGRGELLIKGYIDAVNASYADGQHAVEVRGRNAAGDLCDCCYPASPGEWHGLPLARLVKELIKPWGLAVRDETGGSGGVIGRFRVREGETVSDAIERAVRLAGMLATSDPDGTIVLTRAVVGGAAIEVKAGIGGAVIAGRAEYDFTDRYSAYTVKGQAAGDTGGDAARALHAVGAAQDDNLGRFRPLVLLAEDQADTAACRRRALWEAAVRAGRSARVTYTVTGWRPDGVGALWAPNTLARFTDNALGLADDLLVSTIALSQDDQGTRAELTCLPPGAFTPEPPEADDDGWRKKRKTKDGAEGLDHSWL